VDWVLQRRAAALIECGRYAEAKSTLKRYLSLVPDDAAQWIALGILQSDDDEFEAAFASYQRAETLEPDLPALRLNWGVTAVRAHQVQIARAQLEKLQALEPRSSRPWLLAAFILEEEGDVSGARRIYDRIVARARFQDHAELTYAYEMAMDFYARHKLRLRCERLFAKSYASNSCTVELCEAHREAAGDFAQKAYWFSLMVEADYRTGLAEVYERRDGSGSGRYTRFMRDYQIVARDRDDAVSGVLDFVRRMGEGNPCVREFIGEEPLDDVYTGIYEIETEALVFGDDDA
jgi:tetratricopeptide (TPR) repeat protein